MPKTHLLNSKPRFLFFGFLHCNFTGVTCVCGQWLKLDLLSCFTGLGRFVCIAHNEEIFSSAERVLVHCARLQQHLAVSSCIPSKEEWMLRCISWAIGCDDFKLLACVWMKFCRSRLYLRIKKCVRLYHDRDICIRMILHNMKCLAIRVLAVKQSIKSFGTSKGANRSNTWPTLSHLELGWWRSHHSSSPADHPTTWGPSEEFWSSTSNRTLFLPARRTQQRPCHLDPALKIFRRLFHLATAWSNRSSQTPFVELLRTWL